MQHPSVQPVLGRKLEEGGEKMMFLPRSCFESQGIPSPQQNNPQITDSQARRFYSIFGAGSAAEAAPSLQHRPSLHAAATLSNATINGPVLTNGNASASGGDGWAFLRQQAQHAADKIGDFAWRQGSSNAGAVVHVGVRRNRPRPSSARESATHASLVYDKASSGGVGWGGHSNGDAAQASFFPLLGADEDSLDRPHPYQNPNQRCSSHFSTGRPSSALAAAAAAASAAEAEAGVVATRILGSTGTAVPRATPRTSAPNPNQQRERGVGQPLRAHPTSSSTNANSSSRTTSANASGTCGSTPPTSGRAITSAVGGSMLRQTPGNAPGSGASHKPFTPRTLSLAKEARAKLVVGRGATAVTPAAHGSGVSNRVGAPPSSKGQVRHLAQASGSANSFTVSSPASSSSGTGVGGGGTSAPPHGGSNGWNGGTGGSSGGVHGQQYSHSTMRLAKDSSGGTCATAATSSSSVCSSSGVCGGDGDGSLRRYRDNAIDRPHTQQQPQARKHKDVELSNSASASSFSVDGAGSGWGSIVPGPEGAVEVRELDGGVLVVRRSGDEKKRSPERLNLHRRQLKSCPLVQGDSGLRLLNYQNNLITSITNLANLPNLIFLDLYNNRIDTLEGPLSTMSALRVIMIGKNRIDKISNLASLSKLDVLDLHSNTIREIGGLATLQQLRVLNLAGNRIRVVEKLSSLTSLTELNLRRNSIEKVTELDALPRLQRLFLSNNRINTFQDCHCIFSVGSLIELSLDGNSVAGENGVGSSYRRHILQHLPSLHHLDLKRVTGHDLPVKQAATKNTAHSTNSRPATGNNREGSSSQASTQEGSRSSPPTPTTLTSIAAKINATSGENSHDEVLPVIVNTGEHSLCSGQASEPSPEIVKTCSPCSSSAPSSGDTSVGRHISSSRTGEWTAPRPPSGLSSGSTGNTSPFKERHQHTTSTAESWGQVATATGGSRRLGSGQNTGGNASGGDGGGGGTSRAEEVKEAVAVASAKAERDERERRALNERKEAIDAARACWENRGSVPTRAKARNRSRSAGSRSNSSSVSHPTAASSPSGHGQFSPRSPHPSASGTPSSPNYGSPGGGTSSGVEGRRRGPRGSLVGVRKGVTGGVGYFELEQRLREDGNMAAAAAGEGAGEGGESPSGSVGPGITLKVYGDVWRWMGDGKVCSLREQVVEAQFSHVHVASIADKAAAIAQTFPNLSSLRLLDNDLRSFKQLERLHPVLVNLTTLTLGKNPLKNSASPSALQAFVKTQGSRLRLLSPPQTERHQQRSTSISKSTPLAPTTTTPQSPPPPPAASQPHPLHSTECTVGAAAINGSGEASAISAGIMGERGAGCRVSNGVGRGLVDGEVTIDVAGAGCENGDRNYNINGARCTIGENVQGVGAALLSGGSRRGSSRRDGEGGEGEEDGESKAAGFGWGSRGFDSPVTAAALDCPSHRLTSETTADSLVNPGEATSKAGECNPATLVPSALDDFGIDPSAASMPARMEASTGEGSSSLVPALAGTKGSALSAEAAFERLTEARKRAAGSSWGSVSLAGSGSDKSGVDDAWAASALAAKLVCNGMVRRVCDAHRRDGDFDQAWEIVVMGIIRDVLEAVQDSNGGWSPRRSRNWQFRDVGTNQDVNNGCVRTHTPRASWLEEL